MAYVATHHWVPNFGANLQALGTKGLLQARGFDVKFVDFRPVELVEKYSRSISTEQRNAHEEFLDKYIPLTSLVETQQDFVELCREFPADLYVTGSDAVFRVSATNPRSDLVFPNPYWLCGVSSSGSAPLKLSLSPSAMGTKFAEMSNESREGMRNALDSMAALSARDDWTLRQLNSLNLRSEVTLTPDPVFSLSEIIRERPPNAGKARPYIVVSTQKRVSESWMEKFTAIANSDGYDVIALPTPEGVIDKGANTQIDIPMGPIEWLKVISGASGYVGIRFHPVVVSLVAGIPIVALDLYHEHPFNARKSKTWLLLKDFDAQKYCIPQKFHRFLSPAAVWRKLEAQRPLVNHRLNKSDEMLVELNTYLDKVLEGA